MQRRLFFSGLAASLLCGLGCAAPAVRHGELTKPGVRYEVGEAPQGWRSLRLEDNDVAYVKEPDGFSLAINSTCQGYDDASLEVLTRHLLTGFTQVKAVEPQARVPLDGREALRSHYTAKLDGVPVEMTFVILKKDGCVYDFTYTSPEGKYAEQAPELERLLQRFHAEPRQP